MATLTAEALRQILASNDQIRLVDIVADAPEAEALQAAAQPKRGRGKAPKGKAKKGQGHQDHVATLVGQIALAGLPAPRTEHRFDARPKAKGGRQWRFDLDWGHLGCQVAVEIDGGIWLQTDTGRPKGHAHPIRFLQDLEKLNAAALQGWLVIRAAPEHIKSGQALTWVTEALATKINIYPENI